MAHPLTRLREEILARGLSALFSAKSFHPPQEFPKLPAEDELDSLDFKNKVLEIVELATMIQAEEADPESMMLFDEALERAAKEILTQVQGRGLYEALRDTDAALTPELIATYAMAGQTVERPARFNIAVHLEEEPGELAPGVREALVILFPDSFDIVALSTESAIEELIERAIVVLEVLCLTYHSLLNRTSLA